MYYVIEFGKSVLKTFSVLILVTIAPLEPAVGFEMSEKMLVILLCNNKLVHLDAKGMAIFTENLCRIKCVYSMRLEKRKLALKFRKTINNTQKTFRSLWVYKSKKLLAQLLLV